MGALNSALLRSINDFGSRGAPARVSMLQLLRFARNGTKSVKSTHLTPASGYSSPARRCGTTA